MTVDKYVQLQNPVSKNYVKIDRESGIIIGYSKTKYKNIKFMGKEIIDGEYK